MKIQLPLQILYQIEARLQVEYSKLFKEETETFHKNAQLLAKKYVEIDAEIERRLTN